MPVCRVRHFRAILSDEGHLPLLRRSYKVDIWRLMWLANGAFVAYPCRDRAEAVGILRAFLEKVGFAGHTFSLTIRAHTAVPVVHLQPSVSRPPRLVVTLQSLRSVLAFPTI